MPKNKQQHAVPECYIALFADADNQVHVFDRLKNFYFHTLPSKIGKESDCYTLATKRGRDDSCDKLNQDIENYCAPLLKTLTTASPTHEQWQAIWVIIANLCTRSRRGRDQALQAAERSAQVAEDMKPILQKSPLPKRIVELFKMGPDCLNDAAERIRNIAPALYPLKVATMLERVAKDLQRKPCSFLIAPEGVNYVTSDDPVAAIQGGVPTAVRIDSEFIRSEAVELFLTLGPRIACRWGGRTEPGGTTVTMLEVERLNKIVWESAYRQLYASSVYDLERVVGISISGSTSKDPSPS
jgi:hypothetical protein